jgi:hypothetical protein
VQVTSAHLATDPLAALARAEAVFVGGGNAFRLLRAGENDVPVLGLGEGSWLQVSDAQAMLGGTAGGWLLARGLAARDVQPGDDLIALLRTHPHYDSPAR